MCESDMVALPRAEAQVQYRNCAESALTMHVYFTHCASARGRALQKNKVCLGIHLRREWDCTGSFTEDTEGDGMRLNAFGHEDADIGFDPLSAWRC